MKSKIQITKKSLSVPLCALVLLSCVPMSAISASAESATDLTVTIEAENGEAKEVTLKDANGDSFYEIYNADDLYAFAQIVNQNDKSINVVLENDIIVNDFEITADSTNARVWEPISFPYIQGDLVFYQEYNGVFDGNDKTISGLYFNDSSENFVGLFRDIGDESEIKNLGIINSYFNAAYFVGGIAGECSGTVTNCYYSGIINAQARSGGLVGGNYGNITDCINEGYVSGRGQNIGGIVGDNVNSTITRCHNTGTVQNDSKRPTGGIAGNNNSGKIINSYNDGSISAPSKVGGIVGANDGEASIIINCYNTGEVSAEKYVGGIVGYNLNNVVRNCYNDGEIYASSGASGGVIGYASETTITNCYNTGKVSGGSTVGGVIGLFASDNTMTNCYNTGKVSGGSTVGGVIGYNYDGNTITNCYYLEDSAVNNNGESLYGIGDTYSDDPIMTASKTKEQFTSGEIADLLQDSVTADENGEIPEIWGQTIGTDTYPVLGGDKVYYVTNCKGENVYSNTNTSGVHNYVKNVYGVMECTDCSVAEDDSLIGRTISIGDKIGVKHIMQLSEKTLNDPTAKMIFTVSSTDSSYTVEVPVSEAEVIGKYHVFTCKVTAKEMTSEIRPEMSAKETIEILYSESSVQEYAEMILKRPDLYSKEQELVKTMLNYGAYAQTYFNYNTDNLANSILAEEDRVLDNSFDQVSANYAFTTAGEQAGVSLYGGTLSLKSETAIKLFFTFEDEEDVEKLGVTVNGTAIKPTKNGKYYEVKISKIPTHLLDTDYNVKIGNYTVTYNAFSYGNSAMNTNNKDLKNTVRALYAFNQTAITYANSQKEAQ